MLFSENFGGKGLNRRAVFPCVQRQAGFAAGLFEESRAVPVVLGWHLGQKQAATASPTDEQTVASDLNGFGGNRLRQRQDAEFDFQVTSFGQRDGRKAPVFESGRARGICDGAIYRAHRKDIAHASPQLAAQVKRSEGAARLGQMSGRRVKWDLPPFQHGENGIVGLTTRRSILDLKATK